VDVVYVTISVVIYAGFPVCLGFIGPEPVANILVVGVGAVIEDGNDDWFDHFAVLPRQRAGNVVNPPEVTGSIRAIVGGRVVD
jgi:hypothetical protein